MLCSCKTQVSISPLDFLGVCFRVRGIPFNKMPIGFVREWKMKTKSVVSEKRRR